MQSPLDKQLLRQLYRLPNRRESGRAIARWVDGHLSRRKLHPFKYNSLTNPSSIRLLRVQPTDDGGLIRCSLEEVDLENRPSYVALSYTWKLFGESGNHKRIINCNGAALSIGQNLYDALFELRKTWNGNFIWIDAICIDQSNVAERSSQVGLMGSIFSAAETVFGWLGRANRFSEVGMQFMATMPRWTDEVARAEIIHDGHTYDSAADFVEQSISTFEYAWGAVLALVFNDWFGRVWVVQEILLARQIVIHLGPHKVPQEMLLNASKWVNYWMHLSQGAPISELDFFSPALRTRDAMVRDARLRFGDILTLYRDRQSTDPRDKVFALLSICDPKSLHICPRHDGNAPLSSTQRALKSELVADYSKSTTEVYMECAKCLLYQEPGLYVLSLVGCDGYFPGRKSMAPGLPSWVPDPSITLLPKPLRSFGGDAFTTATAMYSMFRISEDTQTLHLSAAQWDKVAYMGESHAELVGAMLLALLQGGFLTIASSFGAVYPPTKEPTVSALARTLIADLSDGTHPASPALTISFLNWLSVLVGSAMEIKKSRWNRIFTQALVLRPSRYAYRAENLAAVVETFISTCETPEFPIRQAMETSMGNRNYTGRILNFPRAGVASARRNDAKESQVQDDPDLFAATFNSVGLNRRFFITEKGYMGLGPFTLLEGDTIMLVAGAYVPYVFRPAAAEGGSWVLVGETYIHGIMHGEALHAGELEFKTIDVV